MVDLLDDYLIRFRSLRRFRERPLNAPGTSARYWGHCSHCPRTAEFERSFERWHPGRRDRHGHRRQSFRQVIRLALCRVHAVRWALRLKEM